MGAPTADGEAFYLVDRRAFIPTILTQGPWDPGAQHGGPVAGLLAAIVGATPSLAPMRLVRLTTDLLRPVPLEPLEFERQVLREGKRIQVVDVLLLAGSDVVARATGLRMRLGDDVREGAPPPPASLPGPEAAVAPGWDLPYVPGFRRAVELRALPPEASGGRRALWVRVAVPLLAGHPTEPEAALAVVADFTSLVGTTGVGARYRAVNADLNLHVLRPPEGPWVALTGTTAFSGVGTGLSVAELSDPLGPVGAASCAQVVEPRS